MTDPTFQQLRVFLVVADHGHIGRAAETLYLAQPSVSRHIRALETAVGRPLFLRTHRGVELTPAGHQLKIGAQRTLNDWDAAVKDLSGRVQVKLGAVESLCIGILPRAILRMRHLFPNIEWVLSEGHTESLLQSFANYENDAVLARSPRQRIGGDDESVIEACTEEIVLAVPLGHQLAGQEVELKEVRDFTFVAYSKQPVLGLSTIVAQACEEAGFRPDIKSEAMGSEMLLELVAAGDGIAFVTDQLMSKQWTGVSFVRLRGQPLKSPISLHWRDHSLRNAMHTLTSLIRDMNTQTNPE